MNKKKMNKKEYSKYDACTWDWHDIQRASKGKFKGSPRRRDTLCRLLNQEMNKSTATRNFPQSAGVNPNDARTWRWCDVQSAAKGKFKGSSRKRTVLCKLINDEIRKGKKFDFEQPWSNASGETYSRSDEEEKISRELILKAISLAKELKSYGVPNEKEKDTAASSSST